MKRVLAGIIVKPQGIKGEVKVQAFVDKPDGFCALSEVMIADKVFRILKARANREDVFLLLEGIADRNAAEELRGQKVYVDKQAAEALKEGEFFIEDIVGIDAFVDSEHIGTVKEVRPNRAADILVIGGPKNYLVPFVNKAVVQVDLEMRRIVFDKKGFEEVAYED